MLKSRLKVGGAIMQTAGAVAIAASESTQQLYRPTVHVKLTWVKDWKAYAVRKNGSMVGMIRWKANREKDGSPQLLPFRNSVVEFV